MSIYSQNDNSILLTIDDKWEVSSDDFRQNYLYNLNLVKDSEQNKIDNYLPLFIDFNKKLYQAHLMGLDTTAEYLNEFLYYREMLSEKYFTDSNKYNQLLKEGFDRYQYDLNVSHILLRFDSPQSDLTQKQALDKINKIRKEVVSNKISFEDAAVKYSQDESVEKNKGNLGWMTAFTMIYPFEEASYSLNENEISPVIKTKFGYHLIKLNEKRKGRGKIRISILVKRIPENDSLKSETLKTLENIISEVDNGAKFTDLVYAHSDDKRSAMQGGILPYLTYGKLMPIINDAAYSMKIGKVSEILQDDNFYYIIKLMDKINYDIYDDAKSSLVEDMQKSKRDDLAYQSLIDSLTNAYDVKIDEKAFKNVNSVLLNELKNNNSTSVDLENFQNLDKSLLSVNSTMFSTKEYLELINENPISKYEQSSNLETAIEKRKQLFVDSSVLIYYDSQLENIFPDFASLMRNYRDGLLLFSLMENKIDKFVENDSIALRNFWSENSQNYMWGQRADVEQALIYDCDIAKKVRRMMKRGKSSKEIDEKFNVASNVKLIYKKGIVTKNNSIFEHNFFWEEGVSKVFELEDGKCSIIKINNFVDEMPKTFEEAKAQVKLDFRKYLESKWEKEIKENFKVDINESELQKLKKELESNE
jgi:peptidyl-prolyl cis-trans isomerase SurA